MELPHGVLVRSFRGPIPLAELNTALLKDTFTGFMRASLLQGTITEGVIIYRAGKPVIAFMSSAQKDSPDNEQKSIMAVTANEDSIIELFAFNEGQLRLAMDLGRDFMIKSPLPPPPAPPQPVKVEAPRPIQRPKAEKSPSLPEVRGTFAKSENVESLQSYIGTRQGETGHAVLIGQDGVQEYHLLLLGGKAVAAYSSQEAGTALLNSMLRLGGMVEFYRVDEAIIQSILKMYPHVAAAPEAPPEPEKVSLVKPVSGPVKAEPRPMQVLRPEAKPYVPPATPTPESRAEAHGPRPAAQDAPKPPEKPGPMETHRFEAVPRQGIGVPAKSLFDRRSGTEGMGVPAPESKSTGTLKGDMDDDADFVKKVEKEFVGNVDDLLKRLELSHLKVIPDKKKRL